MKRLLGLTSDRTNDAAGSDRRHNFLISICLIAVILIVAGVFGVLTQYRSLSRNIQNERTDYISEIASQIIVNQKFFSQEYSSIVRDYARFIENSGITEFSSLQNYFDNIESTNLLFALDTGKVIDLDGDPQFFLSRDLSQNLAENKEGQCFTTVSDRGDHWLFYSPLRNVFLDGDHYTFLIRAVPAADFSSNLAISLFDSLGLSCLISRDGMIMIKPKNVNSIIHGVNVFDSLEYSGASTQLLDEVKATINAGKDGSTLFTIKGIDWLLSYTPLSYSTEYIVILVPLSVTARSTYDGLTAVIVSIGLLILIFALLIIFVILYTFRQNRESMRKAATAEAQSAFFSAMSHDIRPPLNSIIGMESIALENRTDPEIVKDCLEKSDSAAHYLLSVLNDVLDMRRIQSGKMVLNEEAFDPNDIITDTNSVFQTEAEKKGLKLSIGSKSGLPDQYYGDKLRIEQILANLVSNAIKFTRSGGNINVDVSREPVDADHDALTFEVSDSGIGMSPKYLKTIFTPFTQERSSFTGQYTGSGLGLSIVHDLVKLMNGTINVESELGLGSKFTILITLKRGALISDRPTGKISSQDYKVFSGKRVLIVEDMAMNRDILKTILRTRFGMECDEAENGAEALELFNNSAPGTYDVIMMDVRMPVMDGLEAARLIRKSDHPEAKAIPILAFSANAYSEDVEASIEAGMNGHLTKPVNSRDMLNEFKRIFG